jgi:hypothetical protein
MAATKVATPRGTRTVLRTVYLVLLWVLLAGLATQFALIGLVLFQDAAFLDAHISVGWILGHMVGPLVLIVGFFARLGRAAIIMGAVNLVLLVVLPVLATLRDTNGYVAALHPLLALAVFTLTLHLAARTRSVVPRPLGAATPAATSAGEPMARRDPVA